MTATVNVAIALRQILDGAAVPFARVKFTLTDADVDGALLLPVTASITVDADGNGSVKWWPNARGTQGTQTLVSVYDAAGKLLCERAATIPAQDCNLHDVLHMTPPPTQDDGVVAVNTARAWASQWAGDIPSTLPVVAPSYSARYYSEYARSWATLTGAEVPGVPGARSAMSWAQEDLRGVTYGGSARDWAIGVGAIDGVSFSAKGYAALAAADRVQTGADATATAGDRVQTGVDRAAAAASDASARGSMLTATAQAALASTYAAQAGSVVQQDLSGTTAAALYRSPNNVVATCFMDTTKDSDPSWPLRTDGTSYAQEALNGTWLGAHASEMDARDYFGSLGAASLVTGDSSTFTNGSGAWGARNSNGSVSVVAGRLRLTCSVSAISGAADLTLANLTVGQRYRIAFTRGNISAGKNQFVDVRTGANGAGTALTSVTLGSQGASLPTELSFVATQTTHYVAWYYSSAFAQGEYIEMDDFTVQPVDLSKNPSGAYYQLSTDGKCYRLWKNLWNDSEFRQGLSTGVTTGPVTATPFVGLTATTGLAYGFDGVTAATCRKNITGATVTGVPYVMTVLVRMDDGGAPSFGSATATAATNDFAFALANAGVAPNTYTVTNLGGSLYRVTATGTAALAGNITTGLWKYNTNSNRTFKASEFQIAFGSAFDTYELRTDVDSGGVSETFRGNTVRAPRFGLPVAESGALTVFDLLSPGRPAWLRFVANVSNNMIRGSISGVAFTQGGLWVSTSVGLQYVDFVGDRAFSWNSAGGLTRYRGRISDRNAGLGWETVDSTKSVPSNIVNAVAATTLPTAPVDPVTGLMVPTIGVAVGTGNAGAVGSVIMHDGSVVNYSNAGQDGASVAFTPRGDVVWGFSNNTFVAAMPLATANVASVLSTTRQYSSVSAVNSGVSSPKRVVPLGSMLAIMGKTGAESNKAVLIRENPGTPGASLAAHITPYSSTGWMEGDIRRALLADTVAGVVSNANLVQDPTFTSTAKWTAFSGATVTAGANQLTVKNVGAAIGYAAQSVATVPGCAYVARVTMVSTTCASAVSLRMGTTSGVSDLNQNFPTTLTPGTTLVVPFTATSTTSWFRLVNGVNNPLDGEQTVWSVAVLAEENVADRSYKGKPSTIFGTGLTRTAVAAAAQLVFWTSWSNDAAWLTTERVTNGTFNADTSGWAAVGGATLSQNGGELVITTNAGAAGGATQAIATVPGARYTATATARKTGSNSVYLYAGTGAWGSTLGSVSINSTVNAPLSMTFTATGTTTYITAATDNGVTTGIFDNISVKAADASGSAANVVQEAASTDLDPGTGGLYVCGHARLPVSVAGSTTPAAGGFGPASASILQGGSFPATPVTMTMNTAEWTKGAGWSASGAGTVSCDGTQVGQTDLTWSSGAGRTPGGYNTRRWTITVTAISGTLGVYPNNGSPFNITAPGTYYGYGGSSVGSNPSTAILRMSAAGQTCSLSLSVDDLGIACAEDRSAAAGPYYRLGCDVTGKLVAELSDGTTTRTATTTVAYNTAQPFGWSYSYDTSGALTIKVNGEQAAQTVGQPLGTLSNAAAVLTIGNRRQLDAAWPDAIAMVRIGMTVPTDDAVRWVYAQERAMFQPGAQITLPDAGAIVDMNYDPAIDTWRVASAANTSHYQGLVRLGYTASAAGSIAKIDGKQGCKVVVRTGTNPGIDYTEPSLNLKEELLRRAEEARKADRQTVAMDWTGGFTANTTNASVNLNTPVGFSMPIGSTFVGAQISHANVPAGATLTVAPNTTGIGSWQMSAPATAGATGAAIGFTDFILPLGYEVADDVSADGVLKQEGANKAYTRLFDGFRERVRFGSAPGAAAWVRINARKAAQ